MTKPENLGVVTVAIDDILAQLPIFLDHVDVGFDGDMGNRICFQKAAQHLAKSAVSANDHMVTQCTLVRRNLSR